MDLTKQNRRKNIIKLLPEHRPYEPPFLYKYRTIDSLGLKRFFTHKEIFLSSPLQFNDPFDCKVHILKDKKVYKFKKFVKSMVKKNSPHLVGKTLNQEVKKVMEDPKFNNPDLFNTAYRTFMDGIGVYSLTEKPDNLLMWSHYANSHKGFCLKFKVSMDELLFWTAFKVKYENTYPKVNFLDFDKGGTVAKWALTKSTDWEYEQEWRIFDSNLNDSTRLQYFTKNELAGVIFGALMPENDKNSLLKIIEQSECNIKLYQAELHEKEYKVMIKETT